MTCLFRTKAWLAYQLKAHYWKGHHVHSPYTYRLFTNVLFERWQYYSFNKIESLRKRTGAKGGKADGPKYTQLLQRLCATNDAENIVEIGRSNGISTMYLASNDSRSTVYNFSDKPEERLFGLSNYKNIRQYKLKDVPKRLAEIETIDILVVKEGAGKAIDKIFDETKAKSRQGSIFVFEGIHRDRDIENRWKNILRSQEITLSIDIFEMGIVWFRGELKRQHYIVKF